MTKENSDLEKLSMLDEKGHRIRINPAEVTGFFRRHRNWTQAVLIVIFLILPWIKIGGHQAILLDIPNRRFAILGLTFWAHDGPLVFFILAILTLGLALATAVLGRVWCGWGCPQTVFIDGVFRRIEALIEGNYIKRRALDKEPISSLKLFKKTLKWTLFSIVGAIISHSFIAYFVGTEPLLKMIQSDPRENWVAFLFTFSIAATITFDFGWFREQFCIIMCPYGRFQSVLMDDRTVNVMYDEKRGEPRKGSVPQGQTQGDCVNCLRCVNVCPTGIDIRNGTQMECIGCTACIDACDEIMIKVKKPKGLISYSSLTKEPINFTRPRTLLYSALIILALIGLTYFVSTRKPITYQVLRGKEAPYTLSQNSTGDGLVINHFRLNIHNQTFEDKDIPIETPPEWKDKGFSLATPESLVKIRAGESKMIHFFVTSPTSLMKGTGRLDTQILIDRQPFGITLLGPL
ncbi:MAG: cytochrome c oxidase accessory protein CcoG [Oligoflexia bacterium]|nr:MAG: cytochrome c oxidase accessory protein CcoG [Oligoflexia bacterium]